MTWKNKKKYLVRNKSKYISENNKCSDLYSLLRNIIKLVKKIKPSKCTYEACLKCYNTDWKLDEQI